MSIGAIVRGLFGPYERQVSNAYRAFFFDIDSYVERLRQWKPSARRILEVGCGEGAVTEKLRAAWPGAAITAIDLTPRLGRLYGGPRERVRFVQCSVQQIAASEPGAYDLVVLGDVLHHVPMELRQGLLDAIRLALAPGGAMVLKEWERNYTPIYWLGYLSDRWLTGDRIAYMTREEARERLAGSFGRAALVAEARIAPWRNNFATLVQP